MVDFDSPSIGGDPVFEKIKKPDGMGAAREGMKRNVPANGRAGNFQCFKKRTFRGNDPDGRSGRLGSGRSKESKGRLNRKPVKQIKSRLQGLKIRSGRAGPGLVGARLIIRVVIARPRAERQFFKITVPDQVR